MTTNKEWLYSLDVADLADWFDAEHAECADEIAELTAQVDELSQQLTSARADCEQYRELFSKAITHAHEIVNLQP